MEIDIAETSRELDPTTSLCYGVYPARRVESSTEERSARYCAKHPADDPWSGCWMSIDPLAEKYLEPV